MGLIIFFFLLFTGLVAIVTYFKTKGEDLTTDDGYFLGGRSLTAGVIAGSLLLTNLSSVSFVGMNGQSYAANMSVMGWEVGSGLTLVIVALLLLPRYLKQGITTIPDFIEARFDSGTKQFITVLFLISYVVNMLPITLYSGAIAMSNIFGIEQIFNVTTFQAIFVTCWIIGIVGAIYAISGGLKAVAVSDTLNGIALVIGGLLIPIFALIYLGNMGANAGGFMGGLDILLKAAPEKLNAIGSEGDPNQLPIATMFTGLLLVNLYYWGTDQSIIQRGLGAKNLKEGQKGLVFAGFLKVMTPLIVIIPGIIGYHIFNGTGLVTKADAIYPILVNTVLPKPLIGFFAAAMLGAILSTFNSVLNSASTLFALNIYKPYFSKDNDQSKVVKAGKIFGTIIAFLAMAGSPFIYFAGTGLFDYLQKINGFFNVPIFTIIFMGYVTRKVPAIAAKIGISFFVFFYALTQFKIINTSLHFLHISAILFVLSCLLMYIIGKFVPRDEDFVLEEANVVDMKPWENRFKVSGIVVYIMLAMYIVFSPLGLASSSGMGLNTLLAFIGLAIVDIIIVKLLEGKYLIE